MIETTKLRYDTAQIPVVLNEDTEKRQAVQLPQLPSLLAQVIRHNEDELAQAQERLKGLLLDWPDNMAWRAQ